MQIQVLVASGKVSIIWQMIFVAFIPIVGIWAFYRIQKLKKMILYLEIPTITLVIITDVVLISSGLAGTPEEIEVLAETNTEILTPMFASLIGFVAIAIFAVYLIHKWSVEWNQKFDNVKSSE